MKKILAVFAALSMLLTVGCGQGASTKVPDVVEMVKERAMDNAEHAASHISDVWGDAHVIMVESGEKEENSYYESLRDVLSGIREEIGAYYVYTMIPNGEGDYIITVDGSEEPDAYGTNYGFEVQFKEAYEEGLSAAARSAWDNGENDPVWSAFYPIKNSEGVIVAIVGVDFPSPEIIDYPEWNRNSDKWNGIEE